MALIEYQHSMAEQMGQYQAQSLRGLAGMGGIGSGITVKPASQQMSDESEKLLLLLEEC